VQATLNTDKIITGGNSSPQVVDRPETMGIMVASMKKSRIFKYEENKNG